MRKREPIRVFEGSAKPYERFWNIRDAADGKGAEIQFYGPISEFSWIGDEITPAMFRADLDKLGGRDVTLRIHSPGGDPIAASVMRSVLADYGGWVTAQVDGLCASAATIVAMGADEIKMQDSAFMMIHDPSVVFLAVSIDVEFAKQLVNTLESVKGSLVEIYDQRTGLGETKISHLMRDETWMSASEAVDLGFADSVVSGKAAKAVENKPVTRSTLVNFVNVPAAVVAMCDGDVHPLPTSPIAMVEESNKEPCGDGFLNVTVDVTDAGDGEVHPLPTSPIAMVEENNGVVYDGAKGGLSLEERVKIIRRRML